MTHIRSLRRGLTLGLAIAAAGVTFSVAAHSFKREPAADGLLPVSDVLDSVRQMGLAPNAQPVRRGPYYIVHAIDPRGVELRVVADAQFGDILSVTPAQPYSFAPNYVRGPRIIHVPQPDEEVALPHGAGSDHAPRTRDNGVAPAAPGLRHPVAPRPRSERRQPPSPRAWHGAAGQGAHGAERAAGAERYGADADLRDAEIPRNDGRGRKTRRQQIRTAAGACRQAHHAATAAIGRQNKSAPDDPGRFRRNRLLSSQSLRSTKKHRRVRLRPWCRSPEAWPRRRRSGSDAASSPRGSRARDRHAAGRSRAWRP